MLLPRRDDGLGAIRGIWNCIVIYMICGVIGVLFMRACGAVG